MQSLSDLQRNYDNALPSDDGWKCLDCGRVKDPDDMKDDDTCWKCWDERPEDEGKTE